MTDFHNVGLLPQMAYHQKADMWPQPYGDSGIHSETGTASPSELGGESVDDDLEKTLVGLSDMPAFDFDQTYISQMHGKDEVKDLLDLTPTPQPAAVSQLQLPPSNLLPMLQDSPFTAELFNNGLPPMQYMPPQGMYLPPDPSSLVSNSLTSLMACQEDMDLHISISNAVQLLCDEDPEIAKGACVAVYNLSKRADTFPIIASRPEIFPVLNRILEYSTDIVEVQFVSETLYNLSYHKLGIQGIFRSGGVTALVKLLGSQNNKLLHYAIAATHNILLHEGKAKSQVRACGGIQKMLLLLKRGNMRLLTVTVDCLRILSYKHQDSKNILLTCDGPRFLVKILNSSNYETLIYTAVRLVKVLSVCSRNKAAIIECGGVQVMAKLLSHSSSRVREHVGLTIRNLSDQLMMLEDLGLLIQNLVRLLGSSSKDMQCVIAGTLANITAFNEQNKVVAVRMGAVDVLLRVIKDAGDDENITEPSVCALRHLSKKHPEEATAQEQIFPHMQLLTQLLNFPSTFNLIKAVLGLMRNLCDRGGAYIREAGILQQLIDVLAKTNQNLERLSSPYIDGVNLAEVMELTRCVLADLSADPKNRAIIHHLRSRHSNLQHLIP